MAARQPFWRGCGTQYWGGVTHLLCRHEPDASKEKVSPFTGWEESYKQIEACFFYVTYS